MSRRRFVAGAGAAGLGLLAGCGRLPWQVAAPTQLRVARVGFLGPLPALARLRAAVAELGYVEGQNLAVEHRDSRPAPDYYDTVAAELVALPVDLLVVSNIDAARADCHTATAVSSAATPMMIPPVAGHADAVKLAISFTPISGG